MALQEITDGRDTPRNTLTPVETPCFKSFRNLIRNDSGGNLTLVTDHFTIKILEV